MNKAHRKEIADIIGKLDVDIETLRGYLESASE